MQSKVNGLYMDPRHGIKIRGTCVQMDPGRRSRLRRAPVKDVLGSDEGKVSVRK